MPVIRPKLRFDPPSNRSLKITFHYPDGKCPSLNCTFEYFRAEGETWFGKGKFEDHEMTTWIDLTFEEGGSDETLKGKTINTMLDTNGLWFESIEGKAAAEPEQADE